MRGAFGTLGATSSSQAGTGAVVDFPHFFWLHIKKSAGITTRKLLQPYYVEVDRSKKPKNFIAASPDEYNDILNNYRVVLGEYQFRRALFAKRYLYKEKWERIYSFAFSREPVDRCISMFYYLYWNDLGPARNLVRALRTSLSEKKFVFNTSYAFDAFLGHVEEARRSDSIYRPLGLHFTTHTAPVWEDVSDLEGNLLLTKVFRLEHLIGGINKVFEACGIGKRIENDATMLNRNPRRGRYTPTRNQRNKIEEIYSRDFEVYETAER